jgi:hypothetical protein
MFFLSFEKLVQDCDRLDRVLTIPHEINDETGFCTSFLLKATRLCRGQVIQEHLPIHAGTIASRIGRWEIARTHNIAGTPARLSVLCPWQEPSHLAFGSYNAWRKSKWRKPCV